MNYNKNMSGSRYFMYLFKGMGVSILVTLVLMIVLTLIMTYTNISEGIIPVVNSLIMILAIVSGAIFMSLKVDNKGWLNGGLVGLLYIIVIIILSNIFIKDFSIDKFVLLKLIVSMVTGAIGGMIGINLK